LTSKVAASFLQTKKVCICRTKSRRSRSDGDAGRDGQRVRFQRRAAGLGGGSALNYRTVAVAAKGGADVRLNLDSLVQSSLVALNGFGATVTTVAD
jgi:hypothetical protein